jgi:hypothetical protein
MADRMEIVGDLEKPLYTDEQWKQFAAERSAQWRDAEREWRTHGTISGKRSVGQPPQLVKRRARVKARGPHR